MCVYVSKTNYWERRVKNVLKRSVIDKERESEAEAITDTRLTETTVDSERWAARESRYMERIQPEWLPCPQ